MKKTNGQRTPLAFKRMSDYTHSAVLLQQSLKYSAGDLLSFKDRLYIIKGLKALFFADDTLFFLKKNLF